ncbi:hypothetical protein [Microbulbifer guangxiensis]|uniref:hypothetical protein n=1 Tax=Microbulbifer guangxiensis TaxID=2904249 RepID=UPI001F355EB3|nr:hypothetical protein [Microbulbifer guangxiensis]
MYRQLSLIALLTPLWLVGCGQKTETVDPTNTEIMEEDVDVEVSDPAEERTAPGEAADEAMSDDGYGQEQSTEPDIGSATELETCSPQWFQWVHEKVVAMPGVDAKVSEMYGDGLPEIGSDEWYVAMDRLTGGDGAHGPDGGSAEWCSMMEQRLDSQTP